MIPVGVIAAITVVVSTWADEPVLTLRGREMPPPGAIIAVSSDGVAVRDGGAVPVVVPWDKVLVVRGEHAAVAEAYMPMAERAWRARARLERGDIPGAEPLFEELFESMHDNRGPTGERIAFGLLRCRIERNSQSLAVVPWVSYLRAREGTGVSAVRDDALVGGVLDGETGLVADLPPIWVPGPAVRVLATGGALTARVPYSTRAEAYAALYLHAARAASGVESALPAVTSREPGVEFVARIVTATTATDGAARDAARSALAPSLDPSAPSWQQAWARLALGRSLLMESDDGARRLGVVELLIVPASFERELPYLAGIALADAAVALESLGDPGGAARLRAELLTRFAGHPACEWDAIRRHGEATRDQAAADSLPPSTETARR
ncbi:MAG: hypothetical protein KIS87_02670 [Phycisphaeraceae bacterium]|nr:hypothetical protein [Phycisphaeraceae bacterium]